MADLSFPQYVVSVLVVILSSLISLAGSALIVKMVIPDLTKVHHQTLLLLSVGDIVLSLNHIITPFMLPEGVPGGRFWASGNAQTCTAAGFILSTGLAFTFWNSVFLSVNFLFQVRYQWTETRIKKYLAPTMQWLGVLFALALTVPGLFFEAYNPTYYTGFCYMRDYPHNCSEQEDVECLRGGSISVLLGQIASYICFLVSIAGFVATFLLYRTVQSTIRLSNRDQFSARTSSNTISGSSQINQDSPANNDGSPTTRDLPWSTQIVDERQRMRLRRVNWQCILYSAAYANTMLWNVLIQVIIRSTEIVGNIGEPLLYSFLLLMYAFVPLQGLFNFLIFITPRYRNWRTALQEESAFTVLKHAISNQQAPTRAEILEMRANQWFAQELENSKKLSQQSTSQRPQSSLAADVSRMASRWLSSRLESGGGIASSVNASTLVSSASRSSFFDENNAVRSILVSEEQACVGAPMMEECDEPDHAEEKVEEL